MDYQKARIIIGLTMFIAISWFNLAYGQRSGEVDQYLKALPSDLELKETVPQKYLMTAVYYNKDIYGNFSDKTRVRGEYTRGLDNGNVRWNNVRIAYSNQLDGVFPEGQLQEYMEDFLYKPSEEIVSESTFADWPANNPNDFNSKNLVWDMMALEAFAWEFFDSVKLNHYYAPSVLKAKVDLAGTGYFENKNIQLNWSGITKMNGELCAVIQFLAMDNPLEINTEINGMEIAIKGRSHYWGNVLVSLEDRQIEDAIMYEDVVMKLKIPGIQDNIVNTTREIKVDKLN
ncbi:MAG: hypothetical protein AMS27_10650 [Bacteroides sp. SM23_62_1]|nr:MAG: hypothetical protein AMS27_10650 [Bacteroides sp. SM23_62_1]